MARNAATLRLFGERPEHRLRAAAEEMLRSFVLGKQIGDEPVITEAAVVGCQMDARAGRAKILDAGCEIGRANTVVERNALNAAAWCLSAVTACPQELADVRQKRRLSDTARDQIGRANV